jgi:hypothetical protein
LVSFTAATEVLVVLVTAGVEVVVVVAGAVVVEVVVAAGAAVVVVVVAAGAMVPSGAAAVCAMASGATPIAQANVRAGSRRRVIWVTFMQTLLRGMPPFRGGHGIGD